MSHRRFRKVLIVAGLTVFVFSSVAGALIVNWFSALAEAAPHVAVEVLVSASPGTQTADSVWYIGDADAITLKPQVLTLASPQIDGGHDRVAGMPAQSTISPQGGLRRARWSRALDKCSNDFSFRPSALVYYHLPAGAGARLARAVPTLCWQRL